MTDKHRFIGFTEPNTTPTPNQFYDFVMAEIDNLAELKCVLYVIRRTYGFLKFVDRIAHSQFEHGITTTNRETSEPKVLDKGTGLSGPSIVAGLNKAIKHGYLRRYIVCPSCKQQVTERNVLEYCMKARLAKKEITVSKNVAPSQCPYCQNRLRGKEQIYYSLTFLDSPTLEYLQGLQGVYKEFKLGLSKLFSTQEKDTTGKSNQEKQGAKPPQAFLSEYMNLLSFLSQNKNRKKAMAAARSFYLLCFGDGADAPGYGAIGQAVKKAGGAGRFAEFCLLAMAARPTGSPLKYIMGIAKGGKRRDKGRSGANSGRGQEYHVADREEFERARREVEARKPAEGAG